MQNSEAMALSAALLSAAGELTQRIHEGVVARGFEGLRPAHGFAFARLSWDGATATDLAAHLGVTKQAASQLVDELVRKGYAERRPHPDDARARLVVMTERGWACARAAEESAADAVRPWVERLGERKARALLDQLTAVAPDGPIRPAW
ncbi:MarR family transcriptional regulator [Streptomyces sp. CB01635]|uniref:MarR family winged helix-turn-helix transcriptional regulator n=1 Tax=unclassified Streptomyces TaxID=2593676 RepID=UPI000C280771|nr:MULTISPECIES: MarR family winged helix-turn-helix transcriptional regulator [unclassified Streptomyces]PJN06632.1 MarR family transcriptional regulator [Streptomyces sp. CB01635]WSE08141.1 MarR family winged helix-turn-helix transcriptional regulator [Streptomyces sp. NBC_01445]